VGIEFGQIVLAVVMALFLQLRRPLSHYGWKDRHSVALKTTCAVSGLSIGLVWLVQRWGQ
jgi:hypothetical protein